MKRLFHLLACVTSAVLLTSCTGALVGDDVSTAQNDFINTAALKDSASVNGSRDPGFTVVDGFYVGARHGYAHEEVGKQAIVMKRTFKSLHDAASRISSLTSMPVSVSGELSRSKRSFGGFALDYEGTVSGLLDEIADKNGLSWKFDEKGAVFFLTETKTYRIVALAGESSLKNTVTNQTGSTGETSSSGSNDERSAKGGSVTETGIRISKLTVWNALEKAVKGMLSKDGKLTVSPATGSLTVTDTPAVHREVERFVDSQNESLAKRVLIKVRVVAVELSDANRFGIDWTAVYTSLKHKITAGISSVPFVKDANNLTFAVIPGSKSPWSGTDLMLSALAEQGTLTNLTSATIMTLNNQPAPLQVGRQISYLKNSSSTLTNGENVANALTPGTINTGFSMNVLAHVLEDNRIVLQFSVDISQLVAMNEVISGHSMIQTPEIDTRNFLQRVLVSSGDTLVLSGFEQNLATTASQGTFTAGNAFFGGGARYEKSRSVIVILVEAESAP